MSDVSIFRRQREFFWAAAIALLLAILPVFSAVNSLDIPVVILLTIFFGVIGVIATLLVIFQKQDAVINRAKNKDMVSLITKVFFYPLISSIAGIITIVSLSFVEINVYRLFPSPIPGSLIVVQDFIVLFLTVYSVFSLAEAIWFLYRIMLGES